MEFVILGNGILGLMTAFQLLRRDSTVKVKIVGKDTRPGSASMAAAAMLNSFAELEKGSLDNDLDIFKFEISRRATALWPDILNELCVADNNVEHGFGTYIINNAAADDLDDGNFDAIAQYANDFSEPFEFVNPNDIPNYKPDPRHRALRALMLKREGWINPKQFISILQNKLKSNVNVSWHNENASHFESSEKSDKVITLESGEKIITKNLIITVGANLSALLEKSSPQLAIQRIFYGVGMSIEMQTAHSPHTHCIRTVNRGLACGVYSVPYGGGRTLIGASNYISPVPLSEGHVGSAYTLLKAAMEQINSDFYKANLNTVNIGWRPTTSDTYPLFGESNVTGIWFLGGTKRDGFHMSPALCNDLVDMIFGIDVDTRYRQLAPERSLIRNTSREKAVEKYVSHKMSALYQHDYHPSKSRLDNFLKDALRNEIENLHERLGIKDWGIPVELIDMYKYGHIKADI
jgi:glycine oxidase